MSSKQLPTSALLSSALLSLYACASSLNVTPNLISFEMCGGEEGAVSSGGGAESACVASECLSAEDCEPMQRCVEGSCYDNECLEGEERACETSCGEGSQVCLGGIWRGCSAGLECGDAGLGGEMVGGVEGGGVEGGGVEGGGVEGGGTEMAGTAPSCEAPYEVCGDSVDQDCDGRLDEGCAPCELVAEPPIVGDGLDNFTQGSGVSRLGLHGELRYLLYSKDSLTSFLTLYKLNSASDAWQSRYELTEHGSARALFSMGAQLGALVRAEQGLKVLKLNTSGGVIDSVRVTTSESASEVAIVSSSRVFVAFESATKELKLRSFALNLGDSSALYQLSGVGQEALNPTLILNGEELITLFEVEGEVYGSRWVEGGSPSEGRALFEGQTPKAQMLAGRLFVAASKSVGDRHQLVRVELTSVGDELTPQGEPRVVYESAHPMSLVSLSKRSNELTLTWRERVTQSNLTAHRLSALRLNALGEPIGAPQLLSETPNTWPFSADALYDAAQDRLWLSQVKSTRIDTFTVLQLQLFGAPLTSCVR